MKSNRPNLLTSRRRFLASAAVVPLAFQFASRHVLGGPGQTPPSEKLNIAGVGIGGMGTGDVHSVATENIAGLPTDPRSQ